MDLESWIETATVLIALFFIAVASMADTAFGGVHKHRAKRLAEEGVPGARALESLLEEPHLFHSTILVSSSLATVVAASLATVLALHLANGWARAAAYAGFALALLVFSHTVPKLYAIQHPEKTALALGRVVAGMGVAVSPIAALTSYLGRLVYRLSRPRSVPGSPFFLDEESKVAGNGQAEEAPAEGDEEDLIEGVFRLADTSVREVMVPRIDIVAIHQSLGLLQAIDVALEAGHSRIPVYDTSIDDIAGILYLKDLLKYLRMGRTDVDISGLARPAYFVPESKKVDELLRELQQRRVHMAIVVDEYGGTSGLATIEDLLEEIVGEIQDEYDAEAPLCEFLNEDEAVLDARANLGDVNEALGVDWEAEESDSLGGLVHERLGKIPSVGDSVTIGGFQITVLSTEGHRLKKLHVTRIRQQQPADNGEAVQTETRGSYLSCPDN